MSSFNHRWIIVFLSGLLCMSGIANGAVIVRFDPADPVVDVGDPFYINIVADIPDAVLGWGLDLAIPDPAIVSLTAVDSIGPSWISAFAADGDDLAAIAFPGSVTGNDILLATLLFSADTIGDTDLLLSVTPGDLNEGFPLDPTGFADITFEPGHVTVIPEPLTLSLLALGALSALGAPSLRSKGGVLSVLKRNQSVHSLGPQ